MRLGPARSGRVGIGPLLAWTQPPAYLWTPPGKLAIEGWEPVAPDQVETERVMLGMRLGEGMEVAGQLRSRAIPLVDAGLLWQRGARVGATPRGQEVLDELIRQLT